MTGKHRKTWIGYGHLLTVFVVGMAFVALALLVGCQPVEPQPAIHPKVTHHNDAPRFVAPPAGTPVVRAGQRCHHGGTFAYDKYHLKMMCFHLTVKAPLTWNYLIH